jgi:uracil-DNA glycosylase family 4
MRAPSVRCCVRGRGSSGSSAESVDRFVSDLADARIGGTFNQYADGKRAALLRERLRRYLLSRADATLLLVGEAPGYRGARVSGIPFTSERQLTGAGPGEASATIVHRILRELGLEDDVLLWNVVPTHPGTPATNRRPTRVEVDSSTPFLRELAAGRRVVAVGRLAEGVLGAPYVRHPSRGGARAFRNGLWHQWGAGVSIPESQHPYRATRRIAAPRTSWATRSASGRSPDRALASSRAG